MSWWDDVFYKLFQSPQGDASWRQSVSGLPGIGALSGLVQRPPGGPAPGGVPQAPLPMAPTPAPPSASPTPSPTARPRSPVQEAIAAIAGQQQNPLYGNIPAVNVYMGSTRRKNAEDRGDVAGRGPGKAFRPVIKQNWQTLQEVIASVNDWGSAEIGRFNKLAIAAGLLTKPTNNLDVIADKWSALAVRTAMMNQRGIMITPWSLLHRYGNGELKQPGRGPRTVTSTSVNLTDAPSARAAINQALEAVLGRGATKSEKAKFQATLAAAEKKNPTKTTTTTNAGGTSVSSTTRQGLNPSTFAEDYALEHNTAEAQGYQAVSTYMNAFFQALAAPV